MFCVALDDLNKEGRWLHSRIQCVDTKESFARALVNIFTVIYNSNYIFLCFPAPYMSAISGVSKDKHSARLCRLL